MDKDENLFDDETSEDDDLLDISLDDLSTEEIEETVNDEPDEDIIELMNLVEKGDADLLGVDEDDEISSDETGITEELAEISDDNRGDTLSSDNDFDDAMLVDTGASDDELDRLFLDDTREDEDSDSELEETDLSDDDLAKLLSEAELEDLSDDFESGSYDEEDINLHMQDYSYEDNETDQVGITRAEEKNEPAAEEVQGDLFDSPDPEKGSEDEVYEFMEDIPEELGGEFPKTIASSDDESGEEPLWESDLTEESVESEPDFETAEKLNTDGDTLNDTGGGEEIGDLDTDSLDELFSEDNLEETAGGESDSALSPDPEIEAPQVEASDENIAEADVTSADEESLEGFFSDVEIQEESFDDETETDTESLVSSEESPVDLSDENFDELDDIPLDGDSLGELLSESDREVSGANKPVPEDMHSLISGGEESDTYESADTAPAEDAEKEDEEVSTVTEEIIEEETETELSVDSGGPEIILSENSGEEETAVSSPGVSVVSEEMVQEAVREVVGEVVERVAREVFTEVAEKIITEAIDSLKKSLEPDSE